MADAKNKKTFSSADLGIETANIKKTFSSADLGVAPLLGVPEAAQGAAVGGGRLPSPDGFLATIKDGLADKWQGVKDLPRDTMNFATSVGENIPIAGPASVGAGEHVGAALKYLTDSTGMSYSDALAAIQSANAETQARKLSESPMSVGVAAPLMGAAVTGPFVPKGYKEMKGLTGSGARIAGTIGGIAADSALRGRDTEEVIGDVKLGGGIQAGLELIPKLGKPVARIFGGVNKSNVEKYVANPERIRGAKTLEDIKDMADTEIGKIKIVGEELSTAKVGAVVQKDKLESALKTAFSNTRERIAGKTAEAKTTLKRAWEARVEGLRAQSGVSLEMADDLLGRINAEKAVLGALSEQAEDALVKTGGEVDKQHLLELVDKIGGGLGVGKNKALIGDEAKAAAQSLFETRQRIAEALPDRVPYEDIRGIMRQLRADISNSGGFNGKAGTFNSTLNGMKKELTSNLSDFLKKESGEYANTMGQMAPRANVLTEVSKNFGDQKQALASMQTIVNGNTPRAKYLRDLLNRFADETGNTDLIDGLRSLEDARGVLNSPSAQRNLMESMPEFRDVQRAEDALGKFNPKRTAAATDLMVGASPQNAAINSLDGQIASTMDANKRFAGWSPQSSQSRLTSAMSGRSIENRRAVEELTARTGVNFTEMLDDRRVADAFEKGFTHGSRNVNLWSIIGSLLGGKALSEEGKPIAQLLGVSFGAHIDSAGPKMTKAALDGFISVKNSRWGPLLEQASDSGMAAMAATHLQLQQDPQYKSMIENLQKEANNPKAADVPKSFDPDVIAMERAKIMNDDDMPSTAKAKRLSAMNKDGYVEIPGPAPAPMPAAAAAPPFNADDLMRSLEAVQ